MKDLNYNFDNKIKRALENYEAPYQPDDWLLMEDKLNAAEDTKRPTLVLFPGRRIIKLLFTGALFFVLAGGAGIGYYQWQNHNYQSAITQNSAQLLPQTPNGKTPPVPAQEQAAAPTPASGNKIATKTATNSSVISKTAQGQTVNPAGSTAAKLSQQATGSYEPASATYNQTLQTSGSSFLSRSSREPLANRLYTNANNLPLQQETTAITNNTGNLPPANAPASEFAANNQHSAGSLTAPAKVYTELKNTATPLKTAPILLQTLPATEVLTLPEKEAKILPAQQVPIVPGKPVLAAAPAPQFPAALPRFGAGAYTAANANWLQNNTPLAGVSYGIQFSYRFARHWSVAAGIGAGYKELNLTTHNANNNLQFDPNQLTDSINTINNATQRYNALLQLNMAEIPVSVQYYLLPGKRFSPFAAAGFSVYLPFNNRLTYERSVISWYSSGNTALQSVIAAIPFSPDPRPVTNTNPDNDPLVNNPNIYDIEEEAVFNNNPFNSYWVNSLPDYQSSITATAVNQLTQIPEAKRPMFDVIHLTLGANFKVSNRLQLWGATQFSGTVKQHKLYSIPEAGHQNITPQRLFTASAQFGVTYLFK